jgi:hypothetical protein
VVDSRVRHIAAAVLGAVLLITLTAAVTRRRDRPASAAAPAVPVVRAALPPPVDPLTGALRAHSAALLRGDETGWLAAVAPRLRERYRGIFRTLRAMRVSAFDYHVRSRAPGGTTAAVDISYCFAGDPCPAYSARGRGGPPVIAQSLTVRPSATGPVITAADRPKRPTHLQPVPWEAGDLVVREGRRVTVAAPRELAGRLSEVVRIADRAAVVDDRYAALIGNPQRRYRVYLATPSAWSSWYAADMAVWVAGYMRPLGGAGADVVLDLASIGSDTELRQVLQHEMGHVATIGGVTTDEQWLVEGLAEYISRRSSVVTGDPPATIVARLPARAGAGRAHAFYARSRLAVQCMTAMYGERAMVRFARLRLRQDETLNNAAKVAFGKSFATVDKACVAWISNRLVTS